MLAQNFKSATDLGIAERQLSALILTLGVLERGEVSHRYAFAFRAPRDNDAEFYFNMDTWAEPHPCGTVCCIGGTAERLGDLAKWELDFKADKNETLHNLFYPNPVGRDAITPAQAAIALRSYLTTGDANWAEALAVSSTV